MEGRTLIAKTWNDDALALELDLGDSTGFHIGHNSHSSWTRDASRAGHLSFARVDKGCTVAGHANPKIKV